MTSYKLILILACCRIFAADSLPIGGISHAGFRVADLEKTRAFYSDVLGFQQAFEQKDAAGKTTLSVFKINDDQFLEFSPGLPPNSADRLNHVAFLTDKLEQLRQLIDGLGLNPPELRTGRDRTRNFSIKEPDGLRIEFVQYEPDSLQAQARGKFAGNRRISTHLKSVGFATSDRDRSVAFFHGKLGFVESHNSVAPPAAPKESIDLLPRGAASTLWFDVPEVDKVVRTLHERGVNGDVILDPDRMLIHLKAPSR